MSKIVITIKDNDDGTVQCTADPNALAIAHKANQPGNKITAGEAYALLALRTIAEKSKAERGQVIDPSGRPYDALDFKNQGRNGNDGKRR